MDDFTRMKLSEQMDEDSCELMDFEYNELNPDGNTAEDFKRKYKEFYTDIKLTIKEDW